MADVKVIHTLEEIKQFADNNGLVEIVMRDKRKKFKVFEKIALDNLRDQELGEKVNKAIGLLNANNQLIEKNAKLLNDIAKLNTFNLALEGLNLCATCAGFAIMYAKLDKMSSQIADVVAVIQKSESAHMDYEFKKVLSEHSNMLDCRKKKSNYSEEKMRELVDAEYNVLNLLMNVFLEKTSYNREELLFSILSLAQMLSVSICYFDEEYYFNNKEAIGEADVWHLSHDSWVEKLSELTEPAFIKALQDYGIFELGLNTIENDCFIVSFYDQIMSSKEDIEDNQELIVTLDNIESLRNLKEEARNEVRLEIEHALEDAGVPIDQFEGTMRVVAAA